MNALAFRNTQFDIVDRNGQPWLKASQLAEALGYSRADKISELYSRNADEFTPCMTETLDLRGTGNLRKEVRIFSLRGAHLLAMFARTEVAKEFRRWVLDVLDSAVAPAALPAPEQFERIFHAFRGSRIEFLYDGKAIWVKASCICTALSIGGSDRIARSLPESRKVYRMRGQQRHVFVDAEAAMRASGYVQRPELAKEWEHWLAEALQAIAPGANSAPPAVEGFDPVERYGLMKLLGTRLLVTLDEHGGPQVRPIPMNSLVVPLDRLADVVSDPCTVPVEYLPGLMQAVAGRLGAAMQRVLPRH